MSVLWINAKVGRLTDSESCLQCKEVLKDENSTVKNLFKTVLIEKWN